ncbi:MAG: 4Fe-4S dicluster domain-containing protein [bacterium]|nr:4Fe-4S dicluster domain-containing protein [bacterium]
MKRYIIEINREKCNGCGLCTTACAEGALVLDEENKATLVKEIYCDGLGACLDVCPVDALKVVEKECDDYDAVKTYEHVKATRGDEAAKEVHGAPEAKKDPFACGCPGTMQREFAPKEEDTDVTGSLNEQNMRSELTQWPIQLHLLSPHNPAFNESDLLIAADCTAFALGAFHSKLLKAKKIAIACPKLDDVSPYVNKLSELIKNNVIYSITVAIMVVPCCRGLFRIVEDAVLQSGKNIAIKKVVVDVEGQII